MAFRWVHRKDQRPVYASIHSGTLTLNLAETTNLTFDGEGRLVGAWMDGVRYRRALDNRVLSKRQDPARPWKRVFRFLPPRERDAVLARAYAFAHDLHLGLERGEIDTGATPGRAIEEIKAWLTRVGAWTLERLEAERERFYRVYKPVPILPPDQYLAVVLQATEGCSYNKCTFCTFYRDRPFRIKPLPEFIEHAEQVKAFLGRGLLMRRHIFLADANAIIVAQKLLLPMLDYINRAFPVNATGAGEKYPKAGAVEFGDWAVDGVYAFVSAPDALRKTPDDFADLRRLGLVRVYVGLETGHDPLRAFLHKEGSAEDALHAVRTIKMGGVLVGVIFMVGVGGRQYREVHFNDTVRVIREMPLGAGDIVYISPFVISPDAPYARDAERAGLTSMSDEEIWQEVQRFRQALRSWAQPRGVKVSYYDIREFVY